MPYPIEIVTTNRELLKYIVPAYQPLNTIQNEFVFNKAPDRLLDYASIFSQEKYVLDDVFDWMDKYREFAGGIRPFIILVVDKPLLAPGYTSLYGGHEAQHGYAVFTTVSFDPQYQQFLYDIVRFCRYYFVRYCLSFINPEVKSHKDTRGCMFDFKNYKPDILKSLSTGNICPECLAQLKTRFNLEIAKSVPLMLRVVSDQFPLSLIMKGGGVKGLAFMGALMELKDYYTFDTFAGTSAGAISAVLLAAGYSPQELLEIMSNKDFNDFKDANWRQVIINIFKKKGAYEGNHFSEWINTLIKQKIPNQLLEVKMRDLQHRAIVYASRSNEGILRFDSNGERRETIVSFAARCSMSIPGFFTPVQYEGYKVYDGGIGNNFPLRTFIDDNPENLFLGLYLQNQITPNAPVLKDLEDIITDANERQLVDRYPDRVVLIDPYPIKTTQFDLTEDDKTFLIECGRVGALKYLLNHRKDIQIDSTIVQQVSLELEVKREKLINPFEVESN